MSKLRTDSTWNALTPEQMKTLERWLFVERMGYKETSERVQKEWGIACSLWSVGRFYQRRVNERTLGEVAEAEVTAGGLNTMEGNVDNLRAAAWRVLNTRVLDKMAATEDVKEMALLGRLLSESEWTVTQRARMELARERFEFKAAEAALAQLPKLEKMNLEDIAREKARVHAVKVNLFGRKLPELPAQNDQCPKPKLG